MHTNLELEEAQELLQSWMLPLGAETVPLLQAPGRVAAEDLAAGHDLPAYPQAVLDGYAIIPEGESGSHYRVKGNLAPAEILTWPLAVGTAVEVVTGGPVPVGTGAVVPFESVRLAGEQLTVAEAVSPGDNLKRVGEDFHAGDILLQQGTCLTPGLIGGLAAFGFSRVPVYRRPRVTIVCLGRAIIPCQAAPSPGQLRDSNGPHLAALVSQAGGLVLDVATVGDESTDRIQERLEQCLRQADIVLTTGGAAAGQDDLARYILKQMGARILFWGVKIKPGSHCGAASYQDKLVISLSGNPVACVTAYHLLAAPLLRLGQGLAAGTPGISAICTNNFAKTGGPRRFLQGYASCRPAGWQVTILPGQKSSMRRGLLHSNALIDLAVGHPPVTAGTPVPIILL